MTVRTEQQALMQAALNMTKEPALTQQQAQMTCYAVTPLPGCVPE